MVSVCVAAFPQYVVARSTYTYSVRLTSCSTSGRTGIFDTSLLSVPAGQKDQVGGQDLIKFTAAARGLRSANIIPAEKPTQIESVLQPCHIDYLYKVESALQATG